MNTVYIALGTNIEPREDHLKEALRLLMAHSEITIEKVSSIYETAPVGYTDQADFLNMVVHVHTSDSPVELLDKCQEIEQQLGRKRGVRFGPRTIDLDILLYNHENSKTERLIIPHPRMHQRAFVLIPLYEIAPTILIQALGKNVKELVRELPETDIKDVRIWMQSGSVEE
ncbi:2-amino-4-hydroxy-6-hydroxymethyldihydropteridine diphosphokinase [Oceanobacillus jordanicus]|uniref:2-amino-4-hydroxy-6-hydroxymethyldihydropteridine diphosphokinase n=1 Tax=Oceanobacillus jordanicus TaxID=2867266 RepID=A0AAW5B9E7_9BACI|nr:2-amino-4-hydroxy-6-hydroxymethyldihydropteridine diphosphokinase [Oceanobacillus jordanicus]MCG3420605.1 2-amino-4-hydroxy-6-hydroxymethyldihydropteridine diphosphokinase [Oceanobacillus jordanicus]